MKADKTMRIDHETWEKIGKLGTSSDSYNSTVSKMLKNYETMLEISRAHMHECPKFKKEILEEMDFDE